jgi:hypothetical protein
VLIFLERVIILECAVDQLVAERFNGEPVLFNVCSVKLEEQVQMAEELSANFNPLARSVSTAETNLEELRNSLQSETDRQISIWVHLAYTEALSLFGTEKEMQAQIERDLLLFKSNCIEVSDNVET